MVGFTWILGFVFAIANSSYVECVYTVINSLQGKLLVLGRTWIPGYGFSKESSQYVEDLYTVMNSLRAEEVDHYPQSMLGKMQIQFYFSPTFVDCTYPGEVKKGGVLSS